MSARAITSALVAAALAWAATTPAAANEPPVLAVRVGWAYGLGGELELRPGAWGIGLSGGYVPGLGPGGYVGAQWGQRELGRSGVVAEAGAFRGVHNPLRVADTGLGAYWMAGYTWSLGHGVTMRAVVGGGLPLNDADHLGTVEMLAKLTIGPAL